MAKGSRRSSPTLFSAAAVPSDATFEARKTPWRQSKASVTSGTAEARRPPNRMASIGTPLGSSHSGAMVGHWRAGAAKRAFWWAAGSPEAGSWAAPFQLVRPSGASLDRPSHQTSLSWVRAVLVKTVLVARVAKAFWLVLRLVPGATPKKPASGVTAYRRPAAP